MVYTKIPSVNSMDKTLPTNTNLSKQDTANPLLFSKAFMIAHKIHLAMKYSSYIMVINKFCLEEKIKPQTEYMITHLSSAT
jgi:hypothetical protein